MKSYQQTASAGQRMPASKFPVYHIGKKLAKALMISSSNGGGSIILLKSDAKLWGWGNNDFNTVAPPPATNVILSPIALSGGTIWKTISVGSQHTLAIKADGTLWAWSNNSKGQLGDNTTTTRSVPVQIGKWFQRAKADIVQAKIKIVNYT